MRVGLSFSRCVRDIVDGTVDIKDVLVVIARTNFDPHNDAQWQDIWEGYGGGTNVGGLWNNAEWSGYLDTDEDRFRSVAIELWETGKFHQPRKFGTHPHRLTYHWLETILPNEEMDSNPAVKKAWEQYQILSGLSNATSKSLKE